MDYTDLINILNSINEDGAKMWTFENITGHKKISDNYWKFKVIFVTV